VRLPNDPAEFRAGSLGLAEYKSQLCAKRFAVIRTYMRSARVESLDSASSHRMAAAASLLLGEVDDGSFRYVVNETGDGALRLVTWKPADDEIEAYLADIDPAIETLYGVVERPGGYLAAAAHVIHGATASLSYERPVGERVDPYTAIVAYAVQPKRMDCGYDRQLIRHIASQAMEAGDGWVTVSVVGTQTVAALVPLEFMGSTELLCARPSDILASCPAPGEAA
jgi:hypothetical protein